MPYVETNRFVFFFNDTATTEIYTLSLHDALPISVVTLPTESVVLISMSCLKISRASCFVCSGPCAEPADEQLTTAQNNRAQRFTACICSPQNEFHEKGGGKREFTNRASSRGHLKTQYNP